jgi:hypothetical protein
MEKDSGAAEIFLTCMGFIKAFPGCTYHERLFCLLGRAAASFRSYWTNSGLEWYRTVCLEKEYF